MLTFLNSLKVVSCRFVGRLSVYFTDGHFCPVYMHYSFVLVASLFNE